MSMYIVHIEESTFNEYVPCGGRACVDEVIQGMLERYPKATAYVYKYLDGGTYKASQKIEVYKVEDQEE